MDFLATHGDTFTFPVAYTLADNDGAALDASGVTLAFNLKLALAASETYRSITVTGNADGTFPAISLGATADLPPTSLSYELLYTQGGTEKTLLTGKLKLVTYAVDSQVTASNLTFTINSTPLQLVALPEAQAAANYASESKSLRDQVVLLHGEVSGFETDFSNYLTATESARDVADSAKTQAVAAQAQVAIDANSTTADRSAVETATSQVAADKTKVSQDATQVAADRASVETLYANTLSVAGQANTDITTLVASGTIQLNDAVSSGEADINAAAQTQIQALADSGQDSLDAVTAAETSAIAAVDTKKSQSLTTIDTQAQQRLDAMDVLHDLVADAKRSVDTSEQNVTALEAAATVARNEVVADSGSTTMAMFSMATATTDAMTNLLTMLNKDR